MTMKDSIMYMIKAYRDYNESGMYMALFLCALIYLWLRNKDSYTRRMWIYPTLALVVLIANPLSVKFAWAKAFDYASRPRLFWILPILCVIAMAAALVVSGCKDQKEKILIGILLCMTIILCGKFKYNNEYIAKPQNIYNLPEEAVEIADYALERMEHPRLVVPMELATCMRIYDPDIRLLYGEDATFGRIKWIVGTPQQEVYEQMIKETPDVFSDNGILETLNCDYVVFDSEFHKDYEQLSECGYHFATSVGQYDVFERDIE